jgi:large subunit ribosomal protein L24
MNRKSAAGKRLRKGDTVVAITGSEKGQSGKVLARVGDKAVVQGLNLCKKHVKRSEANPKGGIIEFERPIHLSNLRLLVDGKAVRLKSQDGAEGKEFYYMEGDQKVIYRSVKKADK